MSLSHSGEIAAVTVSNGGEGTLSWVATSSNKAVSISPESFTGNDKEVIISTNDFRNSYNAQLTIRNVSNPLDTERVEVSVSGIAGCSECPSKTFMLPGNIPITMMSIPAGSFSRGEGSSTITISREFYLGQTEVTKAQWEAVMGPWVWESVPGPPDWDENLDDVIRDPNSPAVNVSWSSVQDFIEALTALTGVSFRLPTPTEWEHACRAGTDSRYYFGDDIGELGDYAWWEGNSVEAGKGFAHGVAQRNPNAFGLFDMHGNVAEWTDAWYGGNSGATLVDPPVPMSPPVSKYIGHLFAGGSWNGDALACGSESGSFNPYATASGDVGFRVATLPESNPTVIPELPSLRGISNALVNALETLDVDRDGLLEFSEALVFDGGVSEGLLALLDSDGNRLLAPSELDSVNGCRDCSTETIMLPGEVPLTMVAISAGSIVMGADRDTRGGSKPETDKIDVLDFQLGQTEVTKAQWEALMGTTPWSDKVFVSSEPDTPAVFVSLNDAYNFILALNEFTGESFRLPSEAEWEYACRAGAGARYYFGDSPEYLSSYAWWYGNSYAANEDYAHRVGQLVPNAFGLFDMHGNVWEWCEDGMAFYLGFWAVIRGGSWRHPAEECSSNNVDFSLSTERRNTIGFRLAR